MKVIILTETATVLSKAQFLLKHKNAINASVELTQGIVSALDNTALLYEMDKPPPINEAFESLRLSQPIKTSGDWVVFWEIDRLGEAAINDYYNDLVDDYLDTIAKTKGWKNQDRLLAAINSTNPNFQQEARYMRQLVDRTWEKAIPIINTEIKELTDNPARRPMSGGELLANLPVWDMPSGF